MLKILVFVVFVLFGVQELNATPAVNVDLSMEWTAGSAVNITVGPEDALYCKLENNMDNRHRLVYEAFGPCRITLDRVTMDDRGYWQIWYSYKWVSVENYLFFVDVLAAPVKTEPRITSRVVTSETTLKMTCSVPEELEVKACAFRDPNGNIFIASPELRVAGSRFKSYAERNNCSLELLGYEYQQELQGIWRCGVHTARDTRYTFFGIDSSILDDEMINYYRPQLSAELTTVEGTEGKENTLFCSVNAAVNYCYYRSPNGTVININPSTSSVDYEYVGNGFDAGECGIRIKNVQPSDDGLWSCNVGLMSSYVEQRAIINFNIARRTMMQHRWRGSEVVVIVGISPDKTAKLEYCRYVRSDGLGFHAADVPIGYVFESYELYGDCYLSIRKPQAVDLLPWTVIGKIKGEDEEVTVTTSIENRPPSSRGISSTTAIILWSSFGIIFIFLMVVSCMPKKNRDWSSQRVARIRNSFRRQPQPQPNIAGLPNRQTTQPSVPTQIINTDTDMPPPYSVISQPRVLH